jgi:hypothetical protein
MSARHETKQATARTGAGGRRGASVVKSGRFSEPAAKVAEEFFEHAKRRRSNKPEDLEPRTNLQKRMQSGSF